MLFWRFSSWPTDTIIMKYDRCFRTADSYNVEGGNNCLTLWPATSKDYYWRWCFLKSPIPCISLHQGYFNISEKWYHVLCLFVFRSFQHVSLSVCRLPWYLRAFLVLYSSLPYLLDFQLPPASVDWDWCGIPPLWLSVAGHGCNNPSLLPVLRHKNGYKSTVKGIRANSPIFRMDRRYSEARNN